MRGGGREGGGIRRRAKEAPVLLSFSLLLLCLRTGAVSYVWVVAVLELPMLPLTHTNS